MKSRSPSSLLLFGSRRFAYWLWVAILLVHLPAVVRDWAALLTDRALDVLSVGFVLLNISILIFILKLKSVRWLEFGRDPRSMMSLLVAIALVHINIGQKPGEPPRALEGTEAIASVFFAIGVAPVQRLLDRVGERGTTRRVRPVLLYASTLQTTLAPDTSFRQSHAPRGPPLG